ncbi:hypothetical protein LX15_000849 [Streptoalloteichus tenebrarius]|uniref:Uncharacterized protein n=1 Tax=Streptoalloteichus tenebrarius (strain ATCC 17920 / DSM 40477 / JCM 4838 / CBS 697.72 / NBRC 16177 / NCIMB 11028 / NRRL B-12390 / A12253. 1 / ISP 5477) TaxID=1933 RepID=A0ABT1HNS1_STRSD|nr:hypothetical protein [Streptoalloteichus tenebrarius]MCP2257164.1 hypothetical protein [Streptoalloteichus tenebrarius]
MGQQIIFGSVTAQGEPRGEGFFVQKVEKHTGMFDVLFVNGAHFLEPPAVVATQLYPDDPTSTTIVNTLANLVILGVTKDRFRIQTGAPNGHPLARGFSFVAVGFSLE